MSKLEFQKPQSTLNKIDLQQVKEALNFYDLASYFSEKGLKVNYDNVIFLCPFHKEKTPSCSYNIKKHFGYCFGCGKHFDCFDYIKHRLNCNFKDALDFVLKFTNLSKDDISFITKTSNSYKKQFAAINKLKPRDRDFTTITEDDVKVLIDSRGDWFLDRGLTKETLDHFEVGFDPRENRVTVPIRDENNILIGLTGRTVHKDYENRKIAKWKHYKGSNISNSFFNIKSAIEESKNNKNSIIICEGPSDVMWLHQNGFKNTIACLTNRISGPQKGILLKNFMTIYLFLDGDAGGNNGKSFIKDEINGYFNLYNIITPAGKDPDDLSKEEIEGLIKDARKI